MTLSDDDVVGHIDHDQAECWVGNAVYFSDLDKHIQDRLRAAEQMAKDLRDIYAEQDASDSSGASFYEALSIIRHRRSLAAYEATFKEEA